MAKKCPPGVICIENMTMFFLAIVILLVIYFISKNKIRINNHPHYKKTTIKQENNTIYPSGGGLFGYFSPPPVPGDVLLDPYVPPLSDERYLVPNISFVPPGAMPINMSTNIGAVDTSYRQMGILTPVHSTDHKKILPLMGRPLFVNRNKWQYYTMSNQNNSVKLPILKNRRSCTNEYGCDQLYTGDTVFVEGYNEGFKISIYDNDTIKYIPFI